MNAPKKDRFLKFRRELEKQMITCQLSAYALGCLTGLDPTFIKKLVVGERCPSRKTVLLVATELREYTSLISDADVHRLIKASGYPPPRNI